MGSLITYTRGAVVMLRAYLWIMGNYLQSLMSARVYTKMRMIFGHVRVINLLNIISLIRGGTV